MDCGIAPLTSRSDLAGVEQLSQRGQFFRGERHAFAHFAVVSGPVAQVVFRFAVIPADQVEFLAPAARGRGQDADGFEYFIFDLRH